MSTPPNPQVRRIPELAGATGAPFHLSGSPTHVAIVVQEPTGPASRQAEGLANWAPRRIFLNVDKITGEQGSPPVDVYLNVPPGDEPRQHPELYVGELPMFGLLESSISDENHTPSGLYDQLEVTRLYGWLATREGWDPRNLRVTFAPRYPGKQPPVQVGRVSLYFA